MTQSTPRTELAEFLRSRRARVQPGDVGLPNGERRRTPGLRREEVAQLADVGVSWYTWLEQGRDIHVSEPLLERLARALKLTPTERAHLFELAHGRPAPGPSASAQVSAALQRVLYAEPNARALRVTFYTLRPGANSGRARALFGVTTGI